MMLALRSSGRMLECGLHANIWAIFWEGNEKRNQVNFLMMNTNQIKSNQAFPFTVS
jgi:hypothetical protein